MSEKYKDTLHTNTKLHLTFIDRLKVVVGWKPNIAVEISFEQIIGGHEVTASDVHLSPPAWMPKRKHPGYIHTTNEE